MGIFVKYEFWPRGGVARISVFEFRKLASMFDYPANLIMYQQMLQFTWAIIFFFSFFFFFFFFFGISEKFTG